jgi:hypothetical protein
VLIEPVNTSRQFGDLLMKRPEGPLEQHDARHVIAERRYGDGHPELFEGNEEHQGNRHQDANVTRDPCQSPPHPSENALRSDRPAGVGQRQTQCRVVRRPVGRSWRGVCGRGPGRGRGPGGVGRVPVKLEEVAGDHVGVKADGLGIRANERAAKDPGWPTGDVVALQALEQRQTDFRVRGDRCQRDTPALPLQAQSAPESDLGRLRPSASRPIGDRLQGRLDQRQPPMFDCEVGRAISSVPRSAHFLLFTMHVSMCRVTPTLGRRSKLQFWIRSFARPETPGCEAIRDTGSVKHPRYLNGGAVLPGSVEPCRGDFNGREYQHDARASTVASHRASGPPAVMEYTRARHRCWRSVPRRRRR